MNISNNIHQIPCLVSCELNEEWTVEEKIPIKQANAPPPKKEEPKKEGEAKSEKNKKEEQKEETKAEPAEQKYELKTRKKT